MRFIHLLGVSQDSIAVLFDLIEEVHPCRGFKLYPNTQDYPTPYLPISKTDYQIMPVGTAPGKKESVFFGCATPKVKATINQYFNERHGISNDQYIQIIHPDAYIAKSTFLGNGVLIEPNAVISSQTSIGFGVYIKRGSLIGHHNEIGDYTDINPGVTLSGKVKIGKSCIIGSGTMVKDNIEIGNNSIIGVGSVVTKDIPANCIAYGNPCKIIRRIT